MTSKLLVSRTFATLRRAEFGFFGVVVYTRVHTPRFCGLCCSAGTFFFACCVTRVLRSNWLMFAIVSPDPWPRAPASQEMEGAASFQRAKRKSAFRIACG